MSLEAAFEELAQAFEKVRNAFIGLRLAAVEDQPERGSVAIVDWFVDFVEDLRGAVEMGGDAIKRGGRAAQVPHDLGTAHQALMECQRVRDLVVHRLSTEPSAHSQLKELRDFGDGRTDEWWDWTHEVFAGLDRCRATLRGLIEPLLVCWQDLAEDLASPLISIHATGIGQVLASNGGVVREARENVSSPVETGRGAMPVAEPRRGGSDGI